MIPSEGTNTYVPSLSEEQQRKKGPYEDLDDIWEGYTGGTEAPSNDTVASSTTLALWPDTTLSSATLETPLASDLVQTFSDLFQPPDPEYSFASDLNVSEIVETQRPGPSTGSSTAPDLRHYTHPDVGTSSQTQQPGSSTWNPPADLRHYIYPGVGTSSQSQRPGPSKGVSPATDLRYFIDSEVGTSSRTQRNTPQSQEDGPTPYTCAPDPTTPAVDMDFFKDVVETRKPALSAGSPSTADFRYKAHLGVGSSSQFQGHTPQTPLDDSSPQISDNAHTPVRDIAISRNVAETLRPASLTGDLSTSNLRGNGYAGVGTSSRPQPHIRPTGTIPQNTTEKQIPSTGSSYTNIGSSSQTQRHALPRQSGAPPPYSNIHNVAYTSAPAGNTSQSVIETQIPGSSTGYDYVDVGSVSQPQRHKRSRQSDASRPYPQIHVAHTSAPAGAIPQNTTEKQIPSTGSSYTNIGSSSQIQRHALPRQSGAPPPYSNTHNVAYTSAPAGNTSQSVIETQVPGSSTGYDYADVGSVSQPQRHKRSRQSDASSSYPHVAHTSAPAGTIPQNTTEKQTPSTGSSYAPELRHYEYPGFHSDPQSQRHMPQMQQDASPSYSHPPPDITYSRAPAVDISSNFIEAPISLPYMGNLSDIDFQGYSSPGVGSSSQLPGHTYTHHGQRNAEGQPKPAVQVAPSKRSPSSANSAVQAARPYPNPASRSLVRTGGATSNVASSSTGSRGSKRDGVDLSAFALPTVEDEAEPSSAPTLHHYGSSSNTPAFSPGVHRSRKRVPLREWKPLRRAKLRSGNKLGIIDFWTKDNVTGDIIHGAYLGDRFEGEHNSKRTLQNAGVLPFPGKTEKGFSIRILWPGYDDYAKKISAQRSLETFSVSQVRDWVHNAFTDFFRVEAAKQIPDPATWLVGKDEQKNVIHVGDLILVRLRQAARGTWVPDIDVLGWDTV